MKFMASAIVYSYLLDQDPTTDMVTHHIGIGEVQKARLSYGIIVIDDLLRQVPEEPIGTYDDANLIVAADQDGQLYLATVGGGTPTPVNGPLVILRPTMNDDETIVVAVSKPAVGSYR
jgi:hypothetical protein